MLPKTESARQPKQHRSQVTRDRIAHAAIQLLGEIGEAGLTHRDVAARAEVSLAATTYHYASKFDLLEHASSVLLEDYMTRFRSFASQQAGLASGRPTFNQFIANLLRNAAGRDRLRSIAWCEIMLISARNHSTRTLATVWYAKLREIWTDIASLLGADIEPRAVQVTIDQTIGLLFIILSLGLTPDEVSACISAGLDIPGPAQLLDRPTTSKESTKHSKGRETREHLLNAAIQLMATHGAGAVTGRSVALKAGVAPAVPPYYFKPVSTLIDAAREHLYEAAKTRYRESANGTDLASASLDQIADLTTAVLTREVTQFSEFNLATLAVEVEAARQPALRPMVGQWVSDRSRAWHRLLTKFNDNASTANGLLIASLFTGMQVRLLATGADVVALSDLRLEFMMAFDELGYAKSPATKNQYK
ncbi:MULTISPECIES: TetR family transcriptional regulator [Burkholderiaceae]|uniref:TetR/AcrR family transcriptional regulator n=1 Tax=Burkholderiaceae TaxID=119060 RepID=UPI00141FC2A1|nr:MULTISPECIES: TetR family transcriptional regulator [Burkholderiaceae]MBN3846764.1 TetR family transcriptional regulator [Paraburkholderia sp. Ac-20342]